MSTDNKELSVSFIIPQRYGTNISKAQTSIQAAIHNRFSYEIIISNGSFPSHQRNVAARSAHGQYFYFLDEDSEVSLEGLDELSELISNGFCGVIGGPATTSDDCTPLELEIGLVLSSLLGGGTARARYHPLGRRRQVSGEELILCNLVVSQKVFDSLGGFKSYLYPGEERDFLHRVKLKAIPVWYSPRLLVSRRHPTSFTLLAQKMFRYGRARGEGVRNQFTWQDLPYLLSVSIPLSPILMIMAPKITIGMAAVYLSVIILSSLFLSFKAHSTVRPRVLSILFLISHVSYGVGILAGLVRKASGIAPWQSSESLLSIAASSHQATHIRKRS